MLPLARINIKSTISSQPSQPSRVSSVCVPDRKQLGRVKRWREGEEGRVSVKEEGKEPRKVEKLLDTKIDEKKERKRGESKLINWRKRREESGGMRVVGEVRLDAFQLAESQGCGDFSSSRSNLRSSVPFVPSQVTFGVSGSHETIRSLLNDTLVVKTIIQTPSEW